MFVLIFISIFVFAILTNIVQLYLLIQVFPWTRAQLGPTNLERRRRDPGRWTKVQFNIGVGETHVRPNGQCQSLRGNWWCTLLRCKTHFLNISILSIHPDIHINLNMYIYIYIFVYLYIYIYIYTFINIHTYTENMFYQDFTRCNHQFGICICAKKWVKLCQRRFVLPILVCWLSVHVRVIDY